MKSWSINIISLAIVMVMTMVTVAPSAAEDKAKDKEECTEQLIGMATCLPYVQGQAKSPTPDCCSGLKQVLDKDKKCLCVIIQERNDPDLGLKINVSIALALPSVCHASADVTKCPALLNLDPHSPDAQIFYQLANGSNKTGPVSGLAAGPTRSVSPTSGSDDGDNNGRKTTLPGKSHAHSLCKQRLGLQVVSHFFVIFYIVLFLE
ncbi:unnamed protein product [Cochlearia groenlandica]